MSVRRAVAVAAVAVAPSLAAAQPQAGAVHPKGLEVRASAAFAPCLRPALEAYLRAGGEAARLTVGDPDPPAGADVVVGDDLEMTRLLEGGGADLATAFDLGTVPWVRVGGADVGGAAASRVTVLGGRAGAEARAWLGAQRRDAAGVAVEEDTGRLRQAANALVPRSLAGPGARRPAAVRPLVATVAIVKATPRRGAAERLLAFLRGAGGRRVLDSCLDPVAASHPPAAAALRSGASPHAVKVVDWWLPQCSLARNLYNDPGTVLGPPDAENLGRETFGGLMSLGQGGFVVVDMGTAVADGPGDDFRVYQTVTGEPVTLYASVAAEGPFVLLGLRVPCGNRTAGVFSNHCDFDLGAGGLPAARYLKIEDGEIYPCLAGGTFTEGADLDAVEVLGSR